MLPLRTLASLIALCLATPGGAVGGTDVSVRLVGGEEVVFRWATDRCDNNDIPDAPARAFRDYRGKMRLLATHYDNRLFTVVDGKPKRQDCRIILESPGDPDPAKYRDRRWITATWTEDGMKIHALVHHEYQGHRHVGACPLTDYIACWYNSVTYARSDDGGITFVQSDPPEVVAAPPFQQNVGQGRHRGFFSPTNIIKRGQYWYVLIYTTGWKGQSPGMCLFRTSDIAEPTFWLAWNGVDFNSRFDDPYLASKSMDASPNCRPVTTNWFGSIQRVGGSDFFIAIFFREIGVGDARSWNLAYSLSRDLLTWGSPVDLKPITYFGSRKCKDVSRYGYAAFIDSAENSLNFDVIGGSADLYLTRFNVSSCRNSFNRDLIRYKIKIDLLR